MQLAKGAERQFRLHVKHFGCDLKSRSQTQIFKEAVSLINCARMTYPSLKNDRSPSDKSLVIPVVKSILCAIHFSNKIVEESAPKAGD